MGRWVGRGESSTILALTALSVVAKIVSAEQVVVLASWLSTRLLGAITTDHKAGLYNTAVSKELTRGHTHGGSYMHTLPITYHAMSHAGDRSTLHGIRPTAGY